MEGLPPRSPFFFARTNRLPIRTGTTPTASSTDPRAHVDQPDFRDFKTPPLAFCSGVPIAPRHEALMAMPRKSAIHSLDGFSQKLTLAYQSSRT
ncbi:hypothetical protein [Sphingobium yanoikuyae]|uniref:hypothetical protein n=1 Tax=Sphingobium yanoikuyae TaxID=13690 RepID=UPI0028AA55C8|nr:hypothetical protein [Sphingobium yanoikuyae]